MIYIYVCSVVTNSYYIDCATAKLPEEFYSMTVLDSLIGMAQTARNYVTKYRPEAELWFGETSSCLHSYLSTVPSTYVAGFMCVYVTNTESTNVVHEQSTMQEKWLGDKHIWPVSL